MPGLTHGLSHRLAHRLCRGLIHRLVVAAAAGTAGMVVSLAATAVEVDTALQPALHARVVLTDETGEPLAQVMRDKTFRIEASIENLAGSAPPAGLYLHGWLRPLSLRNLPCTQAARSYLATGRTPVGSVDLNGPAIGVLSHDNALTIVDPELDLASANLIGANTFDETPTSFVADAENARFLIALPDAGEIQAASVFGARRDTLATGLDRPESLIPDGEGGVWALESASGQIVRVLPTGRLVRNQISRKIHRKLPDRGIDYSDPFTAERLRSGTSGHSVVAASGSAWVLLDRRTGRELARFDRNSGKTQSTLHYSDVLPLEDESRPYGVAGIGGNTLFIHYLDAVDDPVEIELAEASTTLTGDPGGRFVFAYSPDGGAASIVDIARSRLAQVVGANPAIANVQFAGRAAFLMLADQSMIGAIDLSSIHVGQHAEVRQVSLGAADRIPRDVSALLTPLPPSNRMLAVHAGSYTGFVIEDSSAMGDAPPMTALRLRGGTPVRVEAIDRSFREVSLGRFEVSARLPPEGLFELVLTTGIGGLSSCFPVAVDEPSPNTAQEPGRIVALAAGAQSSSRRLKLEDANGVPVPEVRAEVMFSALESSWRYRDELVTNAEGLSKSEYELPPLGAYVVTIRSHDDIQFQPLTITVNSR